MGDRYTLTAGREELSETFSKEISERYQPRYNAAPTQVLPIITQGSEGFSFFYWGQLPERSHNKSIGARLLYAEASKIKGSRLGKQALNSFRCVIPMDGFYAWRQVSKKGRIPHRVVNRENKLLPVAGLWEEFEDDEGQPAHTFRIITTESPSDIADISRTMPLVLTDEQWAVWLSTEADEPEIEAILDNTMTADYRGYTVSPRIEKLSNDSPALIDPFSPADQFGNYSLFD